MARFDINITEAEYYVVKSEEELENGNFFCYDVYAEPGNNININLSGNYYGAYYVLDGVSTDILIASTNVIANDTLRVCFYVGSSTVSGLFNSATIILSDTATAAAYSSYADIALVERDNKNILSTKTLNSYTELFNLAAAIVYIIPESSTGFSTIIDISIYDNLGADITATLNLTITGGRLDILSTNVLTDVRAVIIGE